MNNLKISFFTKKDARKPAYVEDYIININNKEEAADVAADILGLFNGDKNVTNILLEAENKKLMIFIYKFEDYLTKNVFKIYADDMVNYAAITFFEHFNKVQNNIFSSQKEEYKNGFELLEKLEAFYKTPIINKIESFLF